MGHKTKTYKDSISPELFSNKERVPWKMVLAIIHNKNRNNSAMQIPLQIESAPFVFSVIEVYGKRYFYCSETKVNIKIL